LPAQNAIALPEPVARARAGQVNAELSGAIVTGVARSVSPPRPFTSVWLMISGD